MRHLPYAAIILAAALGVAAGSAAAQTPPPPPKHAPPPPPKVIHALRVNPRPPVIDGRLDDAIWHKTRFSGGFEEKEPNEGTPAHNQSEIAVCYDDTYLYIAARLHCVQPDNILSSVTRRDNLGNSERIIISLDTYHDHRTAYTFVVNATGTRADYYHPKDVEYDRDYNYDPVWSARTARTPDGWSAEMKIPFSQLRFRDQEVQVWGININRWVPVSNEDSYWVVVPKDDTGWSSRMGTLVGIRGIQPSRRIELIPYVAGDARTISGLDPADPFHDPSEFSGRAGGDFKMGVGPNLTLEGTVNPDFGQVEADPAEVNLSAYETFFPEKRPFFTEGASLLTGDGPGYFYSRRIGAPPHGAVSGDFTDVPRSTSILGATKLTGRLSSGTSVGVLTALTAREHADVYDAATGVTRRLDVEPLTGYGVLRLQQEFGPNTSTAGILLTGVGRDLSSNNHLDNLLNEQAYTGGADFDLRFSGGAYEATGAVGFSHLRGTATDIERVQRSSTHYYQRPDRRHALLDTTRTSLSGWVAQTQLQKAAGSWLWNVGGDAESPGFDLNDAGQLSNADDIDSWAGLTYRQNQPGSWYHAWSVDNNVGSGWNFDREQQYLYYNAEGNLTLKNYLSFYAGYAYYAAAQSDALTRGGPSMATAPSWVLTLTGSSSIQGRLQWSWWTQWQGDNIGGRYYEAQLGANYRPGTRWEMSLNPTYSQGVNTRQYFGTIDGTGPAVTYDNRYVFASIERSQVVLQARLNYAFTPDMTLELYAEPFAASGRYYDLGELAAPRTDRLRRYGFDGTTAVRNSDGSITVTDGADTFTLPNNDFNYVSFRSNLVLRWEYTPGSTLFLVWQQNRSASDPIGNLVGPSKWGDALTANGDNYFAVKITYWIPFL